MTPIPKKTGARENNDLHLVALTLNVMKCFEKFVISLLEKEVETPFTTRHQSVCLQAEQE